MGRERSDSQSHDPCTNVTLISGRLQDATRQTRARKQLNKPKDAENPGGTFRMPKRLY